MPVKGGAALVRAFSVTIPKETRKAARQALEIGAEEHVRLMKQLVPKKEGDLRDSIGWTWGDPPDGAMVLAQAGTSSGSEAVITIFAGSVKTIVTNSRGIEFQNAFIQEFGRNGEHASPFFYPAARKLQRKTRGRVTRAVNKVIDRNA